MNKTLSIGITGMSCASCVGRVERAINALPGVADSSVNLATGRADIVFNTDRSDAALVIKAINTLGYKVPTEKITLSVQGMSCASCVSRIDRRLAQTTGVLSASINLATERLDAEIVPPALNSAKLISLIADAGYSAETIGNRPDHADRERTAREQTLRTLRRSVVLAIALALPVFVMEMGAHVFPAMHEWVTSTIGMQNAWYLQFALTTAVLFGPGRMFFTKGLPALFRRSPDMNALVALGTSAAYGYSLLATFVPSLLPTGTVNVYFEAAAVIVVLILTGRYLEERAKGRTSEAIRRLMSLQTKTATVLRNGQPVHVDIAQLHVGDVVQIKSGERLPIDGTVHEGESYIDESMISGEPIPVLKSRGANVIGGTMNTAGAFSFRVTKVGDDTALAQIIRMVEQAQGTKLPIQTLLDRVTGVFVPIVIGAALLTFFVWLIFGPDPALSFALVNAVAVLIIACPCAMGLATPTSIMVGTGRAAEIGVLFRKGDALQRLRNSQVVALDKTGTLTVGHPILTDVIVTEDVKEADVLQLIASVERLSEHPVAEAIVLAAQSRRLAIPTADNFKAEPGLGVTATVNGHSVAVGADRFMRSLGLDIQPFATTAKRLGKNAKTPLYVAIDRQLAAIIAVSDPIKEGSKKAIDALHAAGLQVVMITGDNQHTAQAIASQLGIDEVHAEVMPDGKVETIQRLQKDLQGKTRQVTFVGDGINDAPALATADVGIAIGTGTDIAIESADVVLMSGDLRGVSNALAISKATLRNIGQNLFWAFAYNAILIPVAAGALYPAFGLLLSPMLAAGAMAASSVCVLGNALRLRRFVPPL